MNKQDNEFAYHKQPRNKNYFEGWYIKTQTESFSFSFIIGIYQNEQERKGFIQWVNTIDHTSHYEEYEEKDIHIEKNPFSIQLKDNILGKQFLIINMENVSLSANLTFQNLTPLENNIYEPTIMGPFAYLPMECTHSIISLHHDVSGFLTYNDTKSIINGIGYIEKDRGCSFPKQFLWFQSNASRYPQSCFFLSIANIPVLQTSFQGCICVLLLQGIQYRFASYLGCKVKRMQVNIENDVKIAQITLTQRSSMMDICIQQKQYATLQSPLQGKMSNKVNESLDSVASIHFYHKNKLVWEGQFNMGGCEIKLEDNNVVIM